MSFSSKGKKKSSLLLPSASVFSYKALVFELQRGNEE